MIAASEPRVTIVVVNWNKRADVVNLLDSLAGIDYRNFQILVVDNASTDDSVACISAHPVPVTLLQNSENLGGTGGFNTGIRYAIAHLVQDYIWLLDNDAEVTPGTLRALVRAMEEHPEAGVAGSCILSPEDRDLMVEAGGFVDWRSGTWSPNLRYARVSEIVHLDLLDVDYVAACSALVRSSTIKAVGTMDERFFLHWDDIDFCLRVKAAGERVVAVVSSRVYHGVEKGFNAQILYYDFRNALLTVSRHRGVVARVPALAAVCSHALVSLVYLRLLQRSSWSSLIGDAIGDFISGRFGRARNSVRSPDSRPTPQLSRDRLRPKFRNVLVFANGSLAEVTRAVGTVREVAPQATVTLAVSRERAPIFHFLDTPFIEFDLFKDSLLTKLRVAATIAFGRYSSVVSSGDSFTIPYAFLSRTHLVYQVQKDDFLVSDQSLGSLWKVALSFVAGHLAALLLLPVVWVAGAIHAQRGVESVEGPVPDAVVEV